MSKVKFVLVFVFLTLFLLGVSATPEVSAQEPDQTTVLNLIQELDEAGNDAEKVFSQLSPEEQKAVIEALQVAYVSIEMVEKEMAPMQSCGCDEKGIIAKGYNGVGVHLWSYKQQLNWCFDGTNVTSKSRSRWGEVYAPLWQWAGHVGSSESGGVGQTYYKVRTHGEFKLCLGGDIGCIQYAYPWVEQKGYGDGWYEWWIGGL